jgi:hypothetical protein
VASAAPARQETVATARAESGAPLSGRQSCESVKSPSAGLAGDDGVLSQGSDAKQEQRNPQKQQSHAKNDNHTANGGSANIGIHILHPPMKIKEY